MIDDLNRPPAPPSTSPPAPPQERPQGVVLRSPNRPTPVTYLILGLTVLVFLGQLASEQILGVDMLLNYGAKINRLILEGQVWRLITPVLLHGSLLHILFNMMALHSIGRGLEKQYGPWRFLLLYLLGGLAGNVLSFVFSPAPAVGSSTAVFGLLAAEGVLIFQNRKMFGSSYRTMITNVLAIAGINLFYGFTVANIDNWGHLGGLIGGGLFAWLAGPLWDVTGTYPNLSLSDRRSSPGPALLAAGLIALIFVGLAVGVSVQRLGLIG